MALYQESTKKQPFFRLLFFLVTATDAGGKFTTTELFVNLIGAEDGIVLVIDDSTVDEVEIKRNQLQKLLEEQTNFIVSIDHIVPSMSR